MMKSALRASLTSEFLTACEEIVLHDAVYCLMCMRTQDARRVSPSKSLVDLMALMDKQYVWPWQGTPHSRLRLCFVCESRAASALRTLQAVCAAMPAQRLLAHCRLYPNDVTKLDRAIQDSNQMAPLKALALKCEAGLRAARRATTLLASTTQLITSERPTNPKSEQVFEDPPMYSCPTDPPSEDVFQNPPLYSCPLDPPSEDVFQNPPMYSAPSPDVKAEQSLLEKTLRSANPYGGKKASRGAKACKRAKILPAAPETVSLPPPPSPPPPDDNLMPEPMMELIGVKEETAELETYLIEDDDDCAVAEPGVKAPAAVPASASASATASVLAPASVAALLAAQQQGRASHYILPGADSQPVLAVRGQGDRYSLHQVMPGSDGYLYVPSISARIRDNQLEYLHLLQAGTDPPSLGVNVDPLSTGTTNVLGAQVKSVNESLPSGADPLLQQVEQTPLLGVNNATTTTIPTIDLSLEEPTTSPAAPKRRRSGARDAHLNLVPEGPVPVARLKVGAIDWEDKIPDNVIAYCDS